MNRVKVVKLTRGDRGLARKLFAAMAEIFEEEESALSDDYIDRLLGRNDFYAIAALDGSEVMGGLTAYELPLTRAERSELFLYDIAVRKDYQRRGVGRDLVNALRSVANSRSLDIFVAADDADAHAISFYRHFGGQEAAVSMFTLRIE